MALSSRVLQLVLLCVSVLVLMMSLRTWLLIPHDDHRPGHRVEAVLQSPLKKLLPGRGVASEQQTSGELPSLPRGSCPEVAGGAAPEACASQQCCWEIRNERVRALFTNRPVPQWLLFETLGAESQAGTAAGSLPVGGSPLFEFFEGESRDEPQGAADCAVASFSQPSPRSLVLSLECREARDLLVEFHAWLTAESSHYVRFRIKTWAPESAEKWSFTSLRLFTLSEALMVKTPRSHGQLEIRNELEPLDGLPMIVEDRFFAAVEHPLAVHKPWSSGNETHWHGAVGEITHLKALAQPGPDQPWEYGGVFGAISEASQARRAFVTYLHAERPGRRSLMVHYNSWYDFYSYQDEGFNGGFKDPNPNETLIRALRKDKMTETNCLQKVEAIGTELVVRRKTKMDSFLWDDGWDDPNSLWQFDKERFPRSFDPVSAKAKSFGVGTGVWLSPWGGYGFTQETRIAYGEKNGWETNWNDRTESKGFSLAGSNYRKAFHDVAMKMVREQSVNMFKFDGVAGDPRELAIEMEAMLRLILDLRKTSNELRKRSGRKEKKSQDEGGEDDDDDDDDEIWINLTTGTWASPFFLLWADSIWRGGSDIASRPWDWEPDGWRPRGLRRNIQDGLSRRQRWIRWRNLITYVLVVRRCHFFPLSQLMIHGVIVASHGDALHWGLDHFDAVDFAQEVWSFVALGLQLQELYVAPQHMTSAAWDILAEGLQWARREAPILLDSHWAFGDPTDREVYCVASWSVTAERGFLFLHNPLGVHQDSRNFTLDAVLELPAAQRGLTLHAEVVKSIARVDSRDSLLSCNFTQAEGGRECAAAALDPLHVHMLPTEVLVLSIAVGSVAA